jgi:putative tryptophan/tyrosine transport system substrate-binding protein
MKRREFITLMGGTAAIWPLAARSQQQPTTPLIGFLNGRSRAETMTVIEHFRKGLADAGFVEGRNVRVEYRWADGRYDRLPALATEIVDLRPTVIVATGGNVTALAAAAATSTIPIVFAAGGDPIKSGLVASLNRPGGNATGVSLFIAELASKRLEFLREVAPKATTIGILVNPGNPTGVAEARDVEARATTLGLGTKLISAGGAGDLEPAFAAASPGENSGRFYLQRSLPDRYQGSTGRDRDRAHASGHLFLARICGGRGAGELWGKYSGGLSEGRRLCGADLDGRAASRPAGAAADQV